MKPWTRWWWMGSAVDRVNISHELKLYEKAGFGGVEIAPIYGTKGVEDKYIPYLSKEWKGMLKFTTDQAKILGLGVDMNLGTGWPYGGPQVDIRHAATKMVIDEIELKKGDKLQFPLKPKDKQQTFFQLQALRAFKDNGDEINLDTCINGSRSVWKAPQNVKLIALFSGRTKQLVKRAAPGGEGLTLDHLGKESVAEYFNYYSKAFNEEELKVRSFFNDSYEVYGANWTDSFLTEFKNIKGYKLEDYLLHFTGKSLDKDKEARVKSDYREIVNHILLKNFLNPFKQFAYKYGAISRNQAHGSPGNLIDLYASTDIAEIETFGSSKFEIPDLRRDRSNKKKIDPDPLMFKFASSATNISGKKYTSSETFTWLTDHFRTSLSQTKPEVEQLFLAGVNHVFYHGTTYSPKEAPYPGWLFYAAVNFTTSNSFWSHLPGLNEYITRVQSILQSSKANNEILVYWPIYDLWHDTNAPFKQLGVHHIHEWLHPTNFYKTSLQLQKKGYSFDFITDNMISKADVSQNQIVTSPNSNPYKVILVPASHYFSEETLQNLLDLANKGATVIFESFPKDVPGLSNLTKRRTLLHKLIAGLKVEKNKSDQFIPLGKGKIYLSSEVNKTLEKEQIFAEQLVQSGLKFTRRTMGNDSYYYLVNHTKNEIDDHLKFRVAGKHYSLLDPQTGKSFKLRNENGKIRVKMAPGTAWIILVSNTNKVENPYRYTDRMHKELVFSNPWKVTFLDGGPELPKPRTLDHLSFWTAWDDDIANKFSGTAAYETNINLKLNKNYWYQLHLGKVAESARVLINDKEVGLVWSYPFKIDIGDYLIEGNNKIRIEVSNLMANRIRYMDLQKIQWKMFHEINFVNIDYESFDASKWPVMDSGLIGPVQLFKY